MDNISDLMVFRAIVESGSLTTAARLLDSSPPALSRRLAALEQRLGVQLADRTSRRFRLTDEGSLLYRRACAILDQIRDMEAEVAARGGVARGLLRIGAPADFGRRFLAPLVATFTARHPGLETHLLPSDAGLEIGLDGCDLVLRFGLPDDQSMLVRKIASVDTVMCAAPSYIAARGIPGSPAELPAHACLRLRRRHHLEDRWQLARAGETYDVQVSGALSSSSGEVLRTWALAGQGITLEAAWDVDADIAAGRLVRILPDCTTRTLDLYAVFAPGTPVPPRIRLFVEHLAGHLSTAACRSDLRK